MIATGAYLIWEPVQGYILIFAILGMSMTISAIGTLYYYFTMARFMVGGKTLLYAGVILLDFAVFTGAIYDMPTYYLLIYLIAIHAFSGLVDILRANEARIYGAKSWKLKLLTGLVEIFIALACITNINDQAAAVLFYSLGVIYSGFARIVNSFRRTTFVYIQ